AFDPARCTDCGRCVSHCVQGILDPNTKRYRDRAARKRCLGCQGCVNGCPTQARACRPAAPMRSMIRRVLRDARTVRHEPLLLVP
ncbi:MAG: hypothetical protein K8R59_05940, partial [Thermoanaerobaculales bacterium]|nr:hypothetical protein [Thermoanaerobaculales bacterium]